MYASLSMFQGANGPASSEEEDDDEGDQENNNHRTTTGKTIVHRNPVIGLNLNRKSTSTRKKRSSTISNQESRVKAALVDNNSSTIALDNQSNVQQTLSSSSMNDLFSYITQMRKQIFSLTQTIEEQKKLQLDILHNQKKMTKAMRNNNV